MLSQYMCCLGVCTVWVLAIKNVDASSNVNQLKTPPLLLCTLLTSQCLLLPKTGVCVHSHNYYHCVVGCVGFSGEWTSLLL